jgi:hypothetical protein
VQDQKAGNLKEAGLQGVDGIVNMKNKLSQKQMRIAAMAKPFNKITGADFLKLKKNKNKVFNGKK